MRQRGAPKPMIHIRVVDCERLNIREGPIATSKVVKVVEKGTRLMTPSLRYDRIKVYSDEGFIGYALKDYLEREDGDEREHSELDQEDARD